MKKLAVLFVFLLMSCNSNPTGSSTPADISGTWGISYTNLQGSGISCSTSRITYTITQTGSTFTGSSTSTYTLTCVQGTTQTSTASGAVISNGNVNGSSISFDLATSAYHQAGVISGNSISGTCTWSLAVGGSTVVLTGQFGGTRQ